MSTDAHLPLGAGKLFRTIVLMGGSLTLACGGVAETNAHEDSGEGGSTGGSPGGSSSGNGGNPVGATGGTSFIGDGDGDIDVGAGGDAPTVQPGPFDCPPETWDCENSGSNCSYRFSGVGYFRLPQGCACDPSRPFTAADCPDGEVRTCWMADENVDGVFTQPVPFDCECVPKFELGCGDSCAARSNPSYGHCESVDDNGLEDIICGCELPILK